MSALAQYANERSVAAVPAFAARSTADGPVPRSGPVWERAMKEAALELAASIEREQERKRAGRPASPAAEAVRTCIGPADRDDKAGQAERPCGASLAGRHGKAIRCELCAAERERAQWRVASKRSAAKKRSAEAAHA